MVKIRLSLYTTMIILLAALLLFPGSVKAEKVLYIGGTMSLTGPYSQDSAAMLVAFENYVKYVNETKLLAPWRTEKFPADITLEVLWRDDEVKPAKALTIYEELKAKGILVYRISGSPIALALKDRLNEDHMGATSMASGPYLLKPPQTIFTHYPIYTDSCAAIADWFKEHWKEAKKPRVAYLTADNAMGKTIEDPEMQEYLKKLGYEFVGSQYVPLVPTAPPTTQLMWLKENKVDLALGVMVNPGSQPTVKEMRRLGMGPDLEYKIVFGSPNTTQMGVFAPAMSELGNGFVTGGSFPPFDEVTTPGVKFCNELQDKYGRATNTSYIGGFIEAMTQVEALRLALKEVPFDKLKPVDVLEKGYYKIKNLETGGLSSTPLNYAPGKIEGVDGVRIDQLQKGKIVKLGVWPCRHVYSK
jgi:ABC-type branched-subunit amino acid transport system substrate-binding protein